MDANNLYGWAMSQKLPINGFKWVRKSKLLRFNERFIKNYHENSDIGYFLEADIDYPKELLTFIKIYHFYQKEKKFINAKNLFVVLKTKKNMLLI